MGPSHLKIIKQILFNDNSATPHFRTYRTITPEGCVELGDEISEDDALPEPRHSPLTCCLLLQGLR